MRKQGSDDLSYKKQAIHDVYKQYAQMKQIRDGQVIAPGAEPDCVDSHLTIQKVHSQKQLLTDGKNAGKQEAAATQGTSRKKGGMHSRGKGSANQRKMGLITTQMLSNDAPLNVPSSAFTSTKNGDSRGGSKISLYTDQFENRTVDGEESNIAGKGTAVLTDPKINLFGQEGVNPLHHSSHGPPGGNHGKKQS